MEENETTNPNWGDAESRLEHWRMRAHRNQVLHYAEARSSKRLHYWIGTPTIALAALVSALAFAGVGLEGKTAQTVTIVIGSVSALVTILSALQTFWDFGSKADSHLRCGNRFGKVARDIEALLAVPKQKRGSIEQVVDRFSERMNQVAAEAPPLSEKTLNQTIKQVSKEAQDDQWGDTETLKDWADEIRDNPWNPDEPIPRSYPPRSA